MGVLSDGGGKNSLGRRLRDYVWQGGQWVYQGVRETSETVYDVLLRQRFKGGDIKSSGEGYTEPEKDEFTRVKSYIVWYSGSDYKTRREISVFFWMRTNQMSKAAGIGKELLSRACRNENLDLYILEFWAAAKKGNFRYSVPVATFGGRPKKLLRGEYSEVQSIYDVSGKSSKERTFSSNHND